MKKRLVLRRVPAEVSAAVRLSLETGCSPTAAARANGCDKVKVLRAIRAGMVKLADGNDYYETDALSQWRSAAATYSAAGGLSFVEMRRRFHLKPDQLRKNLPLFSVPLEDLRTPYERSVFSSVSDEATAYWYGFLMADGGIHRHELRLKLGARDRSHLEKFCSFVGGDPALLIKPDHNRRTGRELWKVTLSSREMVRDLIQLGMDYRKSGREQPPTQLEGPLRRHFLRGLFDGDGCIRSTFQHINLISSKQMLDFVTELAAEHGIGRPTTYDLQTYHKSYWYSAADKLALMRLMYANCTVYLQRKYDLAERFAVLT